MRRPLLLLAATLLTLGTGLVTAAPAQAATPSCTSWSTFFTPFTDYEVVHVPSAGYQTGRLDCILEQGHRNDAVKVLQRALHHCHAKTYLAIDGDFGPYTKSAVLAIQIWANRNYNAGLAEDGEYGPQTRRWINYVIFTYPGNQMTPWCDQASY